MVDIEKPAETERISDAPSALHLFRYRGSQMDKLRENADGVLQLEKSVANIDNSLHNLYLQKTDRFSRLSQRAEELHRQLDDTESSIAYGAVYLKMRGELPNIPPKDFMDFFKLCLKINTSITAHDTAAGKNIGSQTLLLQTLNTTIDASQMPSAYERILTEAAHNIPAWFNGNMEAWRIFVYNHATFRAYLNPDLFKNLPLNRQARKTMMLQRLTGAQQPVTGPTYKDQYPDWFLEESDMTPKREVVEMELTEDQEQQRRMSDELDRIKEHSGYLNNTISEKAQRASDRVASQATLVFPDFEHFSDLIFLRRVVDLNARNVNIRRDLPDTAIKSYVDSDNVITDQEPMALFIERKLKDRKVIKSAQDNIDYSFIKGFQAIFKQIKAQQEDGSEAELEKPQTTDEKAFGALSYDLKPFLEVLSVDEISLLEDLLAESEGGQIELFIWDLAGSLSSSIQGKSDQLRTGSLINLRRLTTSFLRNHSGWAYEQLRESVVGNDQSATSFDSDGEPISDIQQEIETTSDEVAQGNLAGWRIFYATEELTDPNHLVEIGGTTIDEREAELDKFLRTEGIDHSIKTRSIMNTLEGIPLIPEKIRWTKTKQVINGVEYIKTKRGAGRIFDHTDTKKKEIIVIYYQKKANEYRGL